MVQDACGGSEGADDGMNYAAAGQNSRSHLSICCSSGRKKKKRHTDMGRQRQSRGLEKSFKFFGLGCVSHRDHRSSLSPARAGMLNCFKKKRASTRRSGALVSDGVGEGVVGSGSTPRGSPMTKPSKRAVPDLRRSVVASLARRRIVLHVPVSPCLKANLTLHLRSIVSR